MISQSQALRGSAGGGGGGGKLSPESWAGPVDYDNVSMLLFTFLKTLKVRIHNAGKMRYFGEK